MLHAQGDKVEDATKTSEDRYRAIIAEYDRAVGTVEARAMKAKTDDERLAILKEKILLEKKHGADLLDLADRHPTSTSAIKSLKWGLLHDSETPVTKNGMHSKAIALLLRDHVTSDRLTDIIAHLTGLNPNQEGANFLHAVLEKNPSREIQGRACFALGLNLQVEEVFATTVQLRTDWKTTEWGKELQLALGDDYLRKIRDADPEKRSKAIESFCQRAIDKYADVPLELPTYRTVGDWAEAALFEMRTLKIGKEAPDIEGEDQYGNKIKLTDSRGKVVFLDFWRSSRLEERKEIWGCERSITRAMKEKPFVILGVSVQETSIKALKKVMDENQLTWRSFADLPKEGSLGPISRRWNAVWHDAFYALDGKGVIRAKWVAYPGEKNLTETLEKLVKEESRAKDP